MVRTALLAMIAYCAIFSAASFGQDFTQKGRINGHATIAPGIDFYNFNGTISLQGDLEYFFHERISLRGEAFWFIDYMSDDAVGAFTDKGSVFSGITYHFKEQSRFNPYLAIQPGVGMARTIYYTNAGNVAVTTTDNSFKIFPMVSLAVGTYYYFNDWFYFFGELRATAGQYFSPFDARQAGEGYATFGLGFSLQTNKEKREN